MSKEKAMELIQAKMKKNKAYKQKEARRKGPYGLVTEFIKDMESVKGRCKSAMDFDMELQREAQLLLDRFKQIDPEVDLELKWNQPDKVESWEDLLVEGVVIKWSRFWLRKHPFEDETKYIDITELFLKGLLED